MQPTYEQQLDSKVIALRAKLAPFGAPQLDVYPSPPAHYRMRAEFRVWHDGDELYYVMFDQATRRPYRVDELPAANQLINQLMGQVIDYCQRTPELRHRLFQVDFLTTTSNQAVVSLLYHRQLDDSWQQQAQLLREHLNSIAEVSIIGRARKQKLVLGQEHVIETLQVAGRQYQFDQVENSFTQPNAYINQRMLHWASAATVGSEGDLLELYCGNGNFSVPLAANFRRVLATEISKSSVASAQKNIAMNGVDNLTIVRLSAEELTQAMNKTRQFRRLEGIDLDSFDCQTVLVDPPRAGIDDDTLAMISQFQTILYISCNPTSLAENLQQLSKTHDIERAALFDQFPFTEHTEAGVLLQRRYNQIA